MIKKKKCNICNNKFYINSKEVYQAQTYQIKMTGLLKELETYDAIDCPNCSCQILLCKRLEKINKKES